MKLHHAAVREGRLSGFLRGELALSSTLVKRLKWEDAFFVNGEVSRIDRYVVKGDEISVRLEETNPAFPAEKGPLAVLYEDEAVLIVDKPSGVWVHPSPSRQTGTLANWAAFHLRNQKCGVHVVTRLDRDTFGIVLFAKNAHIHAILSRSLQLGAIDKHYLAAVCGVPSPSEGCINMPVARRAGGSLLREVRADGQPSVTCYYTEYTQNGAALLSLRPKTGRTHQLRVHCAAAGWPILGDSAYGTPMSLAMSEAFGITTQQLCAKTLRFPHPLTGEQITVSSLQNPIFPKLTVESRGK